MHIINVTTDWWIFAATIGAGILSSLATWFAVVYTNKKTAEKYTIDKLNQEKANAMVIVKPTIRFGAFSTIMDELVVYNNRDRVLVLSSEKDGFGFYDDADSLYNFNHSIFSIHNGSSCNIHFVKITTNSKITTESNAIIEDTVENIVKLLRSNEEILFRMHNTEQRNKLWEELAKGRKVDLFFDCKIEYLTSANDQILYHYITNISNNPLPQTIDGKVHTTNDRKISVVKDEYKILDKVTLNDTLIASVFRNLQDKVPNDRIVYAQKKVGAAQVAGMMTEFNKFGAVASNTLPKEEVATHNET